LTPEQFAALANILQSLQSHLHPYLVARAEDPVATRAEIAATLDVLLEGLRPRGRQAVGRR